MLTKAGTEGKRIVFLFSDNQIKDESFVEDINMILNTGDVPNLYPADEKADIIEKMQLIARTQVHPLMYPLMYLLYTLLCTSYVPLILCTSYVPLMYPLMYPLM